MFHSEVVTPKHGAIKVIIAADCTGHGVPGAFMTVMGNNLLNEIVNRDGTIEPSLMLGELDQKLTKQLHREVYSYKSNDGMDMSVIVLNENAMTLRFAGAKNPLYYVKKGQPIERIKRDKLPIGGQIYEDEKTFRSYELPVEPGDMYYIFSDGYQDQFGGRDGRKFMSRRFREYLGQISQLSCEEQAEALGETMD